MALGKTSILAVVLALVVVVGGVGVYIVATKSTDTGRVSILVKDSPDDWDHVNVTFSEVSIHAADAGNESGWRNLDIQNGTIDLASLTNVSELLASGKVPAGKYTQIRIVVVSAVGTMEDGTVVNFTVPSGELRTTHPFNVTADHTETLTLDFDLSESIIHNSSGWIFKPVLGSISDS
jgi:hypothetical protein